MSDGEVSSLSKPIRVVVVDDFAAFRRLIVWIFNDWAQLKVIGEAANGSDAISMCQELQPDLVVLDISLPDSNGVEVARHIRTVAGNTRIVFASENHNPETAREALAVGNAFVVKSDATRDLLAAIDAALNGKRFVSRSLAQWKLT